MEISKNKTSIICSHIKQTNKLIYTHHFKVLIKNFVNKTIAVVNSLLYCQKHNLT